MADIRSDSMYRKTSVIDNKYLDVWNPDITDISLFNTRTITLESKYQNRPDLLAYDLYGNSKLWWVFAQFNQDKLKDPVVDFLPGLEIQVPTKFT